MVRSKCSVIIGGSSGDSGRDGGIGELLIREGQARVNEGRQFMFMIYEEDLYEQKVHAHVLNVCTVIRHVYMGYTNV